MVKTCRYNGHSVKIANVTGYAKRDHIPRFIKIELLTPLECAICGEWNGTIDALI